MPGVLWRKCTGLHVPFCNVCAIPRTTTLTFALKDAAVAEAPEDGMEQPRVLLQQGTAPVRGSHFESMHRPNNDTSTVQYGRLLQTQRPQTFLNFVQRRYFHGLALH